MKRNNIYNKWVKLICGASNEDIASIEDLCAIYTAAGVDYIDIAADPSVARAARNGINWSKKKFGNQPGLMISISDGKDIHFRKAKFDPRLCPADCPRPCEIICPTSAITNKGIEEGKCYGCGRCISTCPLNLISEYQYGLSKVFLKEILLEINPDAVEIHTEINRQDNFKEIAKIIKESGIHLKKISVSCGLTQSNSQPSDLAKIFWSRYKILAQHNAELVWQLDGRPMSGDLAPSTARASINLFKKMRGLLPPGLIQLAGGTNENTYRYLNNQNIPDGIAFGSVARKLVKPFIDDAYKSNKKIYEIPEKMNMAIVKAKSLIEPWKNN